MNLLDSLFDPSGLTPHSFCLLWQPGLIWLHALSDAAIALAYFTIPVALTWFVHRRRDLAFGWIYLVFAAFILSCGLTHVMAIITLWVPVYGLEGVLKLFTAVVSLTAAVMTWWLIPRVLAFPSLSALRHSEARQREMIIKLPAPLYSLDVEGRVTEASDYMAGLIGVARDRMIGRPIADFLLPSQRAPRREALELALRTDEVCELETQFLHASGAVVDAMISSRVQRGMDGTPESVLTVVTDVTARRLAEAALRDSEERLRQSQKMEAIGKLTGGIAHDFNNMLTVIEANLERVRERIGQDESALGILDQASFAAGRADRLIAQLLAFSRRQRLDPRPIDAREVTAGMKTLLSPLIGEGILLVIEDDDRCWPCLADRNQLEAGLVNLVINAVQAVRDNGTHGGEIRISLANLTVGSGDDWRDGGGESLTSGDYVRVSVSDNGTGMSEEIRQRALEPFFTTRMIGQGSGLGLSQTYGFVRQSQGAMRIASAVGRGTTVEILLPRAVTPDMSDAETGPVPLAGPLSHAGDGRTLLVVEDEPAVLEIAASSLGECGFNVIRAADGPSALAALSANPDVALVFTDIVMPGQNGVLLAADIWRIRPGLPVIFASGYSEETLTRQLPPGARFIKKPYRVSAVVAAIRSELASRSADRTMAEDA